MQEKNYLKKAENILVIKEEKIDSYEQLLAAAENLSEQEIHENYKKILDWVKNHLKDEVLFYRLSNLVYKENIIKTIKDRYNYLNDLSKGIEKPSVQVNLNLYVNSVKLILDKEKCIRCGISHTVCPKEAVTLEKDKIDVRKDKCVLCGLCVPFCPTGALEIFVDNEKKDLMEESIPELPDYEAIEGRKIKRIFDGSITIDEKKCPERCEECVIYCPVNALEREGSKVLIDRDKCILCGACENACPEDAVDIKRNRIYTKEKKYFSASWTEVNEKFLGKQKINVLENAKSMDKIISIIKDSELKEYTE
ncbi:4Fe-4S dicluster domain-containing protein [Candidatus Woesearchaeota archaeon]|nr:4Fe-4S dicluster domain-containing protein [Candidatus Woesearchaeota archaeon]